MPLLRYDCVIGAARDLGWRIIGVRSGLGEKKWNEDPEYDLCNVYWIDVANIAERMSKIRPWQRVNHFPGMSNIARKNRLAQNLEKMRREFPKEYSFYPKTWVLPLELADFRAQFDSNGKSSRFYIVKPDSGCQGRGIFMTQEFDSISPLEQVVAQQYIRKPYLIDGFKFDLRLYVLVASCKPLRMYLFHDGLVRLCTEEYLKPNADNVRMRCMHLTNYAINKHNEKFQSNKDAGAGDIGSKRSLRWFMEYMANEKGKAKADLLWRRMGNMCVKVVVSILPILVREYESTFFKHSGGQDRPVSSQKVKAFFPKGDSAEYMVEGSRCFEILGVDVIVDTALKPWLIEVNHLPSFATDSPLDLDIKSRVIGQTMSIVKAKANDRRAYEQAQRCKAEGRLYNSTVVAPSLEAGKHTSEISTRRSRIEGILRRHAPDKLAKVNALLCKYSGREQKLVELIERKYLSVESSDSAGEPQDRHENIVDDDRHDKLEETLLVDFERIYPAASNARKCKQSVVPDFNVLIGYVVAQDEKRLRRMSCPLRQNRGSALDFAATLPPLNDLGHSREGRFPWGHPFHQRSGGKNSAQRNIFVEHKQLPMPGHKQVAAADRLTRGFSSRQHASAPSSLEGSADDIHKGQPSGHTQKISDAMAHSRAWRRRLDEISSRRNDDHIVLQPKTFDFAKFTLH